MIYYLSESSQAFKIIFYLASKSTFYSLNLLINDSYALQLDFKIFKNNIGIFTQSRLI